MSFVHVREGGIVRVATGHHKRLADSNHEMLFRLGTEYELFSGDVEPNGGGVFNLVSGDYERDSYLYGEPDRAIKRHMGNRL